VACEIPSVQPCIISSVSVKFSMENIFLNPKHFLQTYGEVNSHNLSALHLTVLALLCSPMKPHALTDPYLSSNALLKISELPVNRLRKL
jgi:hypothetical protein